MKSFLLPLVFLFITSCTTYLKIETDEDKAYDLSSYKSFSIEVSDMYQSYSSTESVSIDRTKSHQKRF